MQVEGGAYGNFECRNPNLRKFQETSQRKSGGSSLSSWRVTCIVANVASNSRDRASAVSMGTQVKYEDEDEDWEPEYDGDVHGGP